MKVLAINGSARKDGNTAAMLRMALAEIDLARQAELRNRLPALKHRRLERKN